MGVIILTTVTDYDNGNNNNVSYCQKKADNDDNNIVNIRNEQND